MMTSKRGRNVVAGIVASAAFCLAPAAHPQGCAQCRETVGQTPAPTQTAYRGAIVLMVAAGCTVFSGAVITLRRFR